MGHETTEAKDVSHCSFEIIPNELGVTMIRDLNPGGLGSPTIASDAHHVVQQLLRSKTLAPGRRLFFYDPDGDLCELLWE